MFSTCLYGYTKEDVTKGSSSLHVSILRYSINCTLGYEKAAFCDGDILDILDKYIKYIIKVYVRDTVVVHYCSF